MSDPTDPTAPLNVTAWLEGIGLGEYAAAFEKNHVTLALLLEMTADDLKECGVTSYGHRKTLLEEIAKLAAQSSGTAPPAPAPLARDDEEKASAPPAPPVPPPPPAPPPPPPADRAGPSPISEPPGTPPAVPVIPVPAVPRRGFWAGLLASKFLFISIVAHLIFGVGATYFIVQRVQAKRKLTFRGGPPSPNPSKRALEHKVSMAKKKTGGAPPQAKRIVSAGISKVSLPEMPTMPTASSVVPGTMAGMGGAGFGPGMGFGSGSGGGMGGGGGGGGMSFFGFRGAGAGLVGTFYDLKQKRDRTSSGVTSDSYIGIVRGWVDGGLQKGALDDYFRAPNQLSALQFMIPIMPADEAPKAYGVEKEVKPAQWVAHYKGKVSPPKSGTYYFVGAADDVLIVRFNGKLVLDGSWVQASNLVAGQIYKTEYGSHPKGGFMRGEAIQVNADEWYDIDVVIGEQPGGFFWACLCIEEEGVRYKTDRAGMPLFPLFRLSAGKLPSARKSSLPPSDHNGPIWKAQSTASGGSLLDTQKSQ